MTDRATLIINQKKFPEPLKSSLIDIGLTIIEGNQSPSEIDLKRTLACIIGFDVTTIKHPLRTAILKQRMSRHGVPLVTWNRDAPYHNNIPDYRLRIFSLFKPLDIYATHSLIDTRWKFSDNVVYLPNAVNSKDYNLRGDAAATMTRLRNPAEYQVDVSFFGTLLNEHPYKEVVPRQIFFRSLAKALDSHGISHRFIDTAHTQLSLDEQVSLIQSSRINVNFGAYCDYCPTKSFPPAGLPERCFGIPACGGFLLCDRRVHIKDCFEAGRHLEDFETLDECIEKIRYYLHHFELSREIAEAGYLHVMRHHTYANRASALHQMLLAWHRQRGS